MIGTESLSSATSVEVLDEARQVYEAESNVTILKVITNHSSAFINLHHEERPCPEHSFEGYLDENNIKHTLCKVGRPQSNGKIERFYQTYEKQRWRFDSLDEFLTFYNEERPHMSLDWDNLETPMEAFARLLPQPQTDVDDPLATEVSTHD